MRRTFCVVIALGAAAMAKFEPYADNGGTVAGIAGESYCILAADCRLSDQYAIKSRDVQRICAVESGVMLAGCGCFTDLTALQKELSHQSALYRWKHSSRISVRAAAHLLGHVLYSRRLFPYYSFNAIAGIEDGVAHLYRYDCVGSFEDVASLCAGKAEHLIQPFLDRLASGVEEEDQLWLSNTDTFSSSRSPCVAIGLEEAVELLLRAFRAASEREITVGDGLYVWILERGKETVDKRFFSLPQV